MKGFPRSARSAWAVAGFSIGCALGVYLGLHVANLRAVVIILALAFLVSYALTRKDGGA
jgi:hypothetical protein